MIRANEDIQKNMRLCMDYFFDDGLTLKAAAEKAGVNYSSASLELKNRICHSDENDDRHMCKAAKPGYGKKFYCTALHDTDFSHRGCPFYKTYREFIYEYTKSNKMTDLELSALGYEKEE